MMKKSKSLKINNEMKDGKIKREKKNEKNKKIRFKGRKNDKRKEI